MGLELLYAPQIEPVAIDEMKEFLGLDTGDADSDGIVTSLIKAGRQRAEQITGRSLITQQHRLNLRYWPANFILRLPLPPLAWDTVGIVGPPAKSVDSIKYLDASNNLQTLASTEYVVDSSTVIGTIRQAYGKYWPTTVMSAWNLPNVVQVTFTSGYGSTAASVPEEIRQRIKDYVYYCFDRRGIDRDEAYLDSLFEGLSCGSYFQEVG